MKKRLITILILIAAMLFAGCSQVRKAPDNEGIYGTWYEAVSDSVTTYIFYGDNTWTAFDSRDAENVEYYEYKYDGLNGTLLLQDMEYEAVLDETTLKLSGEGGEDIELYRDMEEAKLADPYYYSSEEFTGSIKDKDGWCIKDGVLYAYRGTAEEVTVPAGVTEIYANAFSGDFGYGAELKQVIVTGSVKKIDEGAFAFTNADIIYIDEGVETIGARAFSDSYIDEIHFPESVTEAGAGILETEEGLRDAKIYVIDGSYMQEYFKKNIPYGEPEIISASVCRQEKQ